MPLTFITGPVRSGKSRLAEALALRATGPVTYVATADPRPDDAEMATRIEHHASRRPAEWHLIETAVDRELRDVLERSRAYETLVVDSLGTWLAQRMLAVFDPGDDARTSMDLVEPMLDEIVEGLLAAPAHVIVVCEEVGWGVVPAYPSGRAFRDMLGRAAQLLARRAERAYLVVAGYAVDLHRTGVPLDDVGA